MIDVCAIARLHELSANPTVRCFPITHALFRDYSVGVDRLLRILGDAADEEIWKNVVTLLRRYRFWLTAAPLPFNDGALSIAAVLDEARNKLSAFRCVHPSAAEQLATLIEIGAKLHASSENPIMNFIIEKFPNGAADGALLLENSRLIAPTQRILSQHPATRPWALVTASQLKRETCYRHLLIVGAARWFPDYVITAPRASDIWLIRYAWIRDVMPKRRVFDLGDPPGPNPCETEYAVKAEEILLPIDWVRIQGQGLSHTGPSVDDVPAKIAVLEGEFGVFFEDDESATVLTLDLDADDPTERVRRTPVQSLARGAFVLLRTIGGGDYILPIANKLLGEAAEHLRNCQHEWKAQLRQAVEKSSLPEVIRRLREAGSTCANETNVRNWMSPRNIKTYDLKDFAAIMRVIGLERHIDEYWKAMATISQAHQRAGQQIRRVLLRRLREIDLSVLERDGRLEISLPGVDAGSLTAFRLIDIKSAGQLVATTKLNHPFPIGDLHAPHATR
jgi:hypothetical protein